MDWFDRLHIYIVTRSTLDGASALKQGNQKHTSQFQYPKVPQQKNDIDCGLYVMAFMQAFVDGNILATKSSSTVGVSFNIYSSI